MTTGYEPLLHDFEGSGDLCRWNFPFPMGVFGTLRKGWANNYLMGGRVANHRLQPYRYKSHYKAFLPDFVASGLTIYYRPDASAPFEVFAYDRDQWEQMIVAVDSLEGFTPPDGGWHYHRTLAFLRVLPANFDHPLFDPENHRARAQNERNLGIPVNDWHNYPSIPCWIYSGLAENLRALTSSRTPIIWDGVHYQKM